MPQAKTVLPTGLETERPVLIGDYVLDLSPPRTAVNTHLDLSTEASALQLPTKE